LTQNIYKGLVRKYILQHELTTAMQYPKYNLKPKTNLDQLKF